MTTIYTILGALVIVAMIATLSVLYSIGWGLVMLAGYVINTLTRG